MVFWKLAFTLKWVDANKLRLAVKTESNPFGEITLEEFKQITGQDF
ncbi:XkdX family protein [Brevibacillus sp. NRS-1366]